MINAPDYYITNLIKQLGIKDPEIKFGVWTSPKWQSSLILGNEIVIVYHFGIIGTINIMDDMANSAFRLTSSNGTTDYQHLFAPVQVGGFFYLESPFVSIHKTELKMNVIDPNIFNKIVSGHVYYCTIKDKSKQ